MTFGRDVLLKISETIYIHRVRGPTYLCMKAMLTCAEPQFCLLLTRHSSSPAVAAGRVIELLTELN